MSDLQCAVRVFLAPVDASGPEVERLATERIVSVLAPPTGPAAARAAEAADDLSCQVEHRHGLHDVEALVATLQDLADTHRGEAVLLVVETGLVPQALARLGAAAAPAPPDQGRHVVLLEGDADGWVAR